MKVPTIEQDVLPSVQTSRALKMDIERRSEIPVAKGGTAVYAAVSQLADAATDIGNKMRDADTTEEYFKKRTEMLKQSQQIMTDISTDPMYKQYTNDQLFDIYNSKSNDMRDAIFGDMKWHNAKEKLSNDWTLLDTGNRSKIQIAGWQNTIERAEKDTANQLVDLAGLGAKTGDLAKYNKAADDMLAARVAQGVFTPEEAIAKKNSFNNDMLATYAERYIVEGIVNGPMYRDAYNNLVSQMNELEKNGIMLSPHIKAKIVGVATTQYNKRLADDAAYLNKESTDVVSIYLASLGGVNRYGAHVKKLESFGNPEMVADFKRNWEIAQYQLKHLQAREKSNFDNATLDSALEYQRKTGVELEGVRSRILDGVTDAEKYRDINNKMDASVWAGKTRNSMKLTSSAMDNEARNAINGELDAMFRSNDPAKQAAFSIYKSEADKLFADMDKKHELIATDFYKYVTDNAWLGLRPPPGPISDTPEAIAQYRERQDQFYNEVDRIAMTVGVPKERVTYMVNDQAKADVSRLQAGDSADAAKLFQERSIMYGSRFPSIIQQYERVTPGASSAFSAAQLAGLGTRNPDPAALRTSMDLFGTTTKDLNEQIVNSGRGIKPVDVERAVVTAISPYTDTFRASNLKQPGALDESENARLRGMKDFALSRVASGDTPKEAARAVVDMYDKKYALRGQIRIPRQYNPDTVTDYLAMSLLYSVPNFDFVTPGGSIMDKVDKEIILRTGKFVTLPDDTGVIFIRNTGEPVQLKTGAKFPVPLIYRFSDILETYPTPEPLDPTAEMYPEAIVGSSVEQMRGQ